MFKKSDKIIISIICFFLGIFLISQFYSAKEYKKVIQPENNEVLAIEVAKLTKANADLRRQVVDLTSDLDDYRTSSESRQDTYNKYLADSEKFDVINGEKAKSGQGIVIQISGNLSTPQIIDLINAIKNIGSEIISINEKRLITNTNLAIFSGNDSYEIKVLGNSNLLQSAMERKGGIIEQISTKDININISKSDNIEIPSGIPFNFQYAKIIKETQ